MPINKFESLNIIDEDSFSPQQEQILNYSVISIDNSSDENENPLILKLKLSRKNKFPVILLKRLEEMNGQYAVVNNKMQEKSTKKRCGVINEDSDDDVDIKISPRKIRRSTRIVKKKVDLDLYIDDICDAIRDNNINDSSPVKKSPIKRNLRSNRSPGKSPNKLQKIDNNNILPTTPRRRSSRINLNNNESFQTINNKINNNKLELRSNKFLKKSYNEYFDCDEETEALEIVEALKRSEKDVDHIQKSTGRVLRSRSNSVTVEKLDNSKPKRRTRATSVSIQSEEIKTPTKNRLKMLRDGIITPSMQRRITKIPSDNTPLKRACSKLHVSYLPASLPCREKEYLDLHNFLTRKLQDGCGGCMYVSGVPGTGKTATVTSVINSIHNERVWHFNFININGMRLTEPRQAYVEIWRQLTGKTIPWEHALNLLEEYFTKQKRNQPVVMLIDELDILCTKRQDVVYNLLDWPTKCKGQLIVITIANTMDLPERLLINRVASRLGLTRLTFQAYTYKQLMEIVTRRLTGIDSFDSQAIQLVARKVASVSGDARRALDICRRAAEIAEKENADEQFVNIQHVNKALTAMITQPHIKAIKNCARLQKLILQAIVAEIDRTGVEETTFKEMFTMLQTCCALDGFRMVTSTIAQWSLAQLSASKLVLTDQKCADIYQRIILNVSVHDVYFALKN